MADPKLTYRQREVLRQLGAGDVRRSITNSTMNALKKRGLASYRLDQPQRLFGDPTWSITDAGRQALA
jgi:hypothetical protein